MSWEDELGKALARMLVAMIFVPMLGAIALAPWVAWKVMTAAHSARAECLMAAIAETAACDAPLFPAIEALACTFRGRHRSSLLALSRLLKAGVSLPDALDRLPRLLPKSTRLLIRVANSPAPLVSAFEHSVHANGAWTDLREAFANRIGYLAVVVLAFLSCLSFINYFIMPKFKVIFQDFGITLPLPTLFMIEVANDPVAASLMAATCFSLAGLIGFFVVLVALMAMGWVGADFDTELISGYSLDRGGLLRALGIQLDQKSTVAEAMVRILESQYMNRRLHHRLSRVATAVENGQSMPAALRAEGLLRRSDADALDAAARCGNLPWALLNLANLHDRRRIARWNRLVQIGSPLMVLFLGGLFYTVVVACYWPLMKTIYSLGAARY